MELKEQPPLAVQTPGTSSVGTNIDREDQDSRASEMFWHQQQVNLPYSHQLPSLPPPDLSCLSDNKSQTFLLQLTFPRFNKKFGTDFYFQFIWIPVSPDSFVGWQQRSVCCCLWMSPDQTSSNPTDWFHNISEWMNEINQETCHGLLQQHSRDHKSCPRSQK